MKRHSLVLALLLLSFTMAMAQRTVSGSVISTEGESLIGASVLIKGTSLGTATDIDGNFTLEVPPGSNTLVVSYTGFNTKEFDITGQTSVSFALEPSTSLLDEVVVTAYGTQRKREITGSVASIDNETLEKVQASHVVQGLVGKVAGVQIINQSGQPGDAPTVRFRGVGSINASSEPLYVVDGVPFNGNINSIAPQDIESMTFLKDASANALYGSRGANGVIIITTKKGKTDGLEVSLNIKAGMNDRAVPDYDIIKDPGEFYEVWYDRWRIGLINQGETPEDAAATAAAGLVSGGDFSLGYNNYNVPNDQLIDQATGRLNPSAQLLYQDDWEEELFGTSARTETHLSLRSKGDKVGTFFSMGYLNDEGYALNSGFKRITGRGSFDYDVSDAIKVGASVNYANTTQDAPIQNVATNTYSNLFSWARNVAPIYPVYGRDANGDFIRDNNGDRVYDFGTNDDDIPGVRPYGAFNNPVATSILDQDQNVIDNLSGRAFVTVNFLRDFEFTYNLSADYFGSNITAFSTPLGGDAKGVNGRLTTTANRGITLANQQLLNWRREFGLHNVAILIGHESTAYDFSLLRGQKTETLIGDLPVLNNAANIQYLQGYEKEYRVEGFLSRINYDYDDKYFINASFRRDGSSVFAPENRWGNFYGLGVAWDIAREPFLEGVSALSSLRLKASYGQQGNDAILYEANRTIVGDLDNRNYYAYRDQFDVVNAGGGKPGVSFVGLGNPDLVWETSTNINAGFEAGLFGNRVNIQAEYFVRQVADMLFYNPLPLSEGRGAFPENIGDMENRGVEVLLDVGIIAKSDFNWAVSLNGTHYKNEITRLPQEFIDDPNISRVRLVEGRSRYDIFLRQFAGVDPTNGDALWYMDEVDADGNPTGNRVTTADYNAATEYFVDKTSLPDLFGGFSTSLYYKGLGLNVGFAYQLGGYGYDGNYQGLLGSAGDIGQNYHHDVLNSWTPENPDATIPRLDVFDTNQDDQSDFWLIDNSYLSLQDITLSYDITANALQSLGIKTARVYASANNVYLWSKRQGYDPRLSFTGLSVNEYSIVRSVSIGANIVF